MEDTASAAVWESERPAPLKREACHSGPVGHRVPPRGSRALTCTEPAMTSSADVQRRERSAGRAGARPLWDRRQSGLLGGRRQAP